MQDNGLNLATEKTEIVLLTKCQIPTNIEVEVTSETIYTNEAVKYQGVK